MKTKFLLAAAVVFCFCVSSANAQVKQHAQNQHQRIRCGVKQGELTKAEAKNVIKDQRDIRQDIRLAKADGNITVAERRNISREQQQANREIYRKKHNGRDRN